MAELPSELELVRDKTVALFGLAREGLSSYRYLRQFSPTQKILLIDDLPPANLANEWRQILNLDPHVQVLAVADAQAHFQKIPNETLVVIKSPGIPLQHPLLQHIAEQKIPVTSNLKIFLAAVQRLRREQYQIITVGITGTKGKSTTTSIIHHVLNQSSRQTWLGGNIGVPALQLLSHLSQINQKEILYIVLELSAHQLDDLTESPNWAVIQNIVPEHLDYYDTFERYVAAKSQITRFQTHDDCVIFNDLFSVPTQLAALSPGRKLRFHTTGGTNGTDQESSLAARVAGGWIWSQTDKIVPVDEVPLKGKHNLENIMPAVIVGGLAGLAPTDIANGLRSFKALPHRLEPVGTINGVEYINDSLSTVPEATIAALKAVAERPVVLLAGGYDRGQDFTKLAEYLAVHPIKSLILFPPTGKAIAQAIKKSGGQIPTTLVETMTEAMTAAKKIAEVGDVVLLSPASASFGKFKDYQDRGNQFKALAQEL